MHGKDFDVIVVGAGPAGLTTAYHLLSKGFSVGIIERGSRPGEKNVMGGVMYLEYFKKAFPELPLPPYEREIEAEEHFFITSTTLAHVGVRKYEGKFEAVTLFRSKFDPYLAEKAREKGGEIITDSLVKRVVNEVDRVRVITDRGEVTADFVVGADGVNSVTATSAEIRKKIPQENLFVSVKEVIELTPEVIEKRFGLSSGKGAVIDIIGHPDYSIPGGGFIYTNKESISFGTGARVSYLIKHGISALELHQMLKKHPYLASFIDGGKALEISTHLIPYGYISLLNPFFAKKRVFLAGDAMGSAAGDLSGLPIAFLSGVSVAKAITEIREKGINLNHSNKIYVKFLKQNGLWRIFRNTKIYHLVFRRHERIERNFSKFLIAAVAMLNSLGETGVMEEIKKLLSETSSSYPGEKKDMREFIQSHLDRRPVKGFIGLEDPDICARCENKPCLDMCPGAVYSELDGGIIVNDEQCLECGFCNYFCPYENIEWSYPPGGKGVIYKWG